MGAWRGVGPGRKRTSFCVHRTRIASRSWDPSLTDMKRTTGDNKEAVSKLNV